MKGRVAISCFCLLCLVFTISQSDGQTGQPIGVGAAAHTDGIDDYINHEMPLRKVPGLAFAVVDHGRIVTSMVTVGERLLKVRDPTPYYLGSDPEHVPS
jgi:CubicO group peptidase (beta-lactamase class C family)